MKALDAHIAENAAGEELLCFVCGQDYGLHDDYEDTGICDDCAQKLARDGLRYRNLRHAMLTSNANSDDDGPMNWEYELAIAGDREAFDGAVDALPESPSGERSP